MHFVEFFAYALPGGVAVDLLLARPDMLMLVGGMAASYILLRNSLPSSHDRTHRRDSAIVLLCVLYGGGRYFAGLSKLGALALGGAGIVVGHLADSLQAPNSDRRDHPPKKGPHDEFMLARNSTGVTRNPTFTPGQGFPGPLNIFDPNSFNWDYNPLGPLF